MLVLMELLLLMGQCFDVLAHLLGQVGGHRCSQLALICQSRHLSRDPFGGVIVGIVGGESTKPNLLEWRGRGISLVARGVAVTLSLRWNASWIIQWS